MDGGSRHAEEDKEEKRKLIAESWVRKRFKIGQKHNCASRRTTTITLLEKSVWTCISYRVHVEHVDGEVVGR
jgi:hypothetical protein